MKPGAARWIGAVAAAMLALAGVHWLSHPHPAVHARSLVPVATPPGITLQVRAGTKRARAAAAAEVVYADAKGMTLYVYDKDSVPGTSACVSDCAAAWPPAVASSGATPVGDWSLIARADGARQWVYRGAPLYRFGNDHAVGDTRGDGADNGVWHVALLRPGAGMVLPDDIAVREIADAGGQGLVDTLGMTLYTFQGDVTHSKAYCDGGGDCARRWIPLAAPEIANPAGDFSAIVRDDGITQWAYRGKPLYTFDADQKPGDVNGIGVDARFHVALIVRNFMPADATIRRSVELGDILATAGGATLYQRDRVLTEDEGHGFRADHGAPAIGRSLGTATCDESCAKTWPPFTAPADALPSGYWDIAKRPDGTRQWVYKGFALYTYAADKPGDISGNELHDLGQLGDAPIVAADSSAIGVGIRAMFWHAVVP
jgi:predicted lipoprotein with Yx(FWY)xxD motif